MENHSQAQPSTAKHSQAQPSTAKHSQAQLGPVHKDLSIMQPQLMISQSCNKTSCIYYGKNGIRTHA